MREKLHNWYPTVIVIIISITYKIEREAGYAARMWPENCLKIYSQKILKVINGLEKSICMWDIILNGSSRSKLGCILDLCGSLWSSVATLKNICDL